MKKYIEKQIRGEPAEVRLGVRQARTAPRVKEFGVWLKRQRARVSPKCWCIPPKRAWARSWPTSAITGKGYRCSSPMAAWRWIQTSWKTRSARWR